MRSVLTPCHLGLVDLLDGCLLDSRRLQAEYYDCWTVLARWGTRSPPDWDCVGLAADAQQLIAGIKQQLTDLEVLPDGWKKYRIVRDGQPRVWYHHAASKVKQWKSPGPAPTPAPVPAAPVVAAASAMLRAASSRTAFTGAAASGNGWPPLVRSWVERALSPCKSEAERQIVQTNLRTRIEYSTSTNTFWSTDWDAEPLPDRTRIVEMPLVPTPTAQPPPPKPPAHAAEAPAAVLPGGFVCGDVWATKDLFVGKQLVVKKHSKGTLLGASPTQPTERLLVRWEQRVDTAGRDINVLPTEITSHKAAALPGGCTKPINLKANLSSPTGWPPAVQRWIDECVRTGYELEQMNHVRERAGARFETKRAFLEGNINEVLEWTHDQSTHSAIDWATMPCPSAHFNAKQLRVEAPAGCFWKSNEGGVMSVTMSEGAKHRVVRVPAGAVAGQMTMMDVVVTMLHLVTTAIAIMTPIVPIAPRQLATTMVVGRGAQATMTM